MNKSLSLVVWSMFALTIGSICDAAEPNNDECKALTAFVISVQQDMKDLYTMCPVYSESCLRDGGSQKYHDYNEAQEVANRLPDHCWTDFIQTSFGVAYRGYADCDYKPPHGTYDSMRWLGHLYDKPGCTSEIKTFLLQPAPALGEQKPKKPNSTDLPFVHGSGSDFTFDYELRDDRGQFCDAPGTFFISGTAAPGDTFYVPCDGTNTGGFCMRQKEHNGQKEFGDWHGGYLCGHQKNGGKYEW